MNHLVGIDIGGTNTKIGLIQYGEQFKVIDQTSIPTQANDPAEVYMRRVGQATKKLVQSAGVHVAGAGVGCPGLIDPQMGLVRKSPNMPAMNGFKLKDGLTSALGMGVEIQNDANAAVLGEFLFGPSQGVRNLVMLTLGTGVGGGVVCDGNLLIGADNAATELGHLKVEWNGGAPCGCGKRGCLEAYAGAAGIGRIAESLKAGQTDTKALADAANAGDPIARQVFLRVGHYLGRGISLLIETFNPEKIVIGGGACKAMELLRPGIEDGLNQYASYAFTRQRATIERSAFPDDINVIGAAATYLNAHR